MEKLTNTKACAIVGGDSIVYENYRWNWSNGYKQCLADEYSVDKHGNKTYNRTDDMGAYACISRGM